MQARHVEVGSAALRESVLAAVAAALPAGASEEEIRQAFRLAGGHRLADLEQVLVAADAEELTAAHHAEARAAPREALGDVVRKVEREARRKARG